MVHFADERKPIESGPYSSLIWLSRSATAYSAESQSVASRLAPRIHSGRFSLSSLSTNSWAAHPLMQSDPSLMGWFNTGMVPTRWPSTISR